MKKKGGGLMGIESDEVMVIKTLLILKIDPFVKKKFLGSQVVNFWEISTGK